MWYFNGGFPWWWFFGGVLMVAFWGVVIALIVWAVRRSSGPRGPQTHPTPLDIAKERYARGQITREQFEQLKRDLSAGA